MKNPLCSVPITASGPRGDQAESGSQGEQVLLHMVNGGKESLQIKPIGLRKNLPLGLRGIGCCGVCVYPISVAVE